MKFFRPLATLVVLLCASANHAFPQRPPTPQRQPIIDMHVHAFGWDHQGNPPPPNPLTGKVPSAHTDKEAMEASLAELRRYNVVRAVASGRPENVACWRAADPELIIGGTMLPLPEVRVMHKEFLAGRLGVMAELALAYEGVAPNDAQMEPYWALAEELDIPVGLHTGLAPPKTPYQCCPKFRNSLGNPALLEEVLIRHPKVRVYLMHAGYPYLQETKAIMHMYPQVYADLAAIDWLRPRDEFHEYLRALVRAGFGKRLMFGSDQIFYNNAVRFLRLDEKKLGRSSSN